MPHRNERRRALNERDVVLGAHETLRVRIDPDGPRGTMVTLALLTWTSTEEATVGPVTELPPNRLHDVAYALLGLADELRART